MLPALDDLKSGIRLLKRQPWVYLTGVVILAVGLCAHSLIFTFIKAVYLAPVKVNDPSSLAFIFRASRSDPYGGFSYPDFQAIRRDSGAFSSIAASTVVPLQAVVDGRAKRFYVVAVSRHYFDLLGVSPALGAAPRFEDSEHGEYTILLSHRIWRERFGSDPGILGKGLSLAGRSFTVGGVAPASFLGLYPGFSPDAWIGLEDLRALGPFKARFQGDDPFLQLIGRLRSGVSMQKAGAHLSLLAPRPSDIGAPEGRSRLTVLPAAKGHPEVHSIYARISALLLVLDGVILLIVLSNLTHLLLASAFSRDREIMLRVALGAGSRRLFRQFLGESLVFSLLAAAAALLLTGWSRRLVPWFLPSLPVPLGLNLHMDLSVVEYTLLAGTLCSFGMAALLSLRSRRWDAAATLRGGEGTSSGSLRQGFLRDLLIVAQVASSVLLAAAGVLALTGLARALDSDPGFSMRQGCLVSLAPSPGDPDVRGRRKVFESLPGEVRRIPGVRDAALAHRIPLGVGDAPVQIQIGGGAAKTTAQSLQVLHYVVSDGFFRVLGIKLPAGREFSGTDAPGSQPVAIVNRTLAEKAWPGRSPLGRLLDMEPGHQRLRVVGVAATGKYRTLNESPQSCVFVPLSQNFRADLTLIVRTSRDPGAVEAGLVLWLQQPRIAGLGSFSIESMPAHLKRARWLFESASALLGVLTLVSLGMTGLGIFAIVFFSLKRRIREIAIRLALGAGPRHLLRLILGRLLGLALLGTAVGAAGLVPASRFLKHLVWTGRGQNWIVLASAFLLLLAVILLAGLIPIRRVWSRPPLRFLGTE